MPTYKNQKTQMTLGMEIILIDATTKGNNLLKNNLSAGLYLVSFKEQEKSCHRLREST